MLSIISELLKSLHLFTSRDASEIILVKVLSAHKRFDMSWYFYLVIFVDYSQKSLKYRFRKTPRHSLKDILLGKRCTGAWSFQLTYLPPYIFCLVLRKDRRRPLSKYNCEIFKYAPVHNAVDAMSDWLFKFSVNSQMDNLINFWWHAIDHLGAAKIPPLVYKPRCKWNNFS